MALSRFILGLVFLARASFLGSCIVPRRFRYGWRAASSTCATAGQRFVFHLALSYPSPVSGEGRPERSGGRGGGRCDDALSRTAPTRHIDRCAHDVPPSPRRRGRDEDP